MGDGNVSFYILDGIMWKTSTVTINLRLSKIAIVQGHALNAIAGVVKERIITGLTHEEAIISKLAVHM